MKPTAPLLFRSLCLLLLMAGLAQPHDATAQRSRSRSAAVDSTQRTAGRAPATRGTASRATRDAEPQQAAPARTARDRATQPATRSSSRPAETGRGQTTGRAPSGRAPATPEAEQPKPLPLPEQVREPKPDERPTRTEQRQRRAERQRQPSSQTAGRSERRPDERWAPRQPSHTRQRVDVAWPWEYRYRQGWQPRYRYRQVVYTEAGWGRGYRDARLDVRTEYRHRVRRATHRKAELDLYIDRIVLYENGRFLGEVHRIPDHLRRIRATVYRHGRVDFDRDVFLLGDRYSGFELISTRHYDGYLLDAYQRAHGVRAGVLDLWRERVVSVSHSRLFDPYDFNGFVPISLMPDDPRWLFDYGYDSVSYYDDGYGGGYYDAPYYSQGEYSQGARGTADVQRRRENGRSGALRQEDDQRYRTERGADIRLQRETEIERLE